MDRRDTFSFSLLRSSETIFSWKVNHSMLSAWTPSGQFAAELIVAESIRAAGCLCRACITKRIATTAAPRPATRRYDALDAIDARVRPPLLRWP